MRCARSRYADAVTAPTPEPGSPIRSVALGVVVFAATLILLFGLLNVIQRSPTGAAVASPTLATTLPTPTRATATPSVAATATPVASSTPRPSAPPSREAVLVGAGDIATCDGDGDSATAALVDGIEGTVFTAGDNAYPSGSATDFGDCYDPSWGRFKDRTRPAAGNHEWETQDLEGYLDYFGTRAAPDGTSWYSYELGAWHVVVLDSDCSKVGGCGPDSAQGRWLAGDLQASTALCTIAIWHHPRFQLRRAWQRRVGRPVLASAPRRRRGPDRQRARPRLRTIRATGPRWTPGSAHGMREFVVGTGGAELRDLGTVRANSELRASGIFGVLRLDLHPSSYDWRFIPTAGDFSDAGTAAPCH